MNRGRFTIRCGDHTLELGARTLLMGTINVTPDSFSDGGLFFHTDQAIKQGELLASEGADILDVGGESTRPFSNSVDIEEELRRVIPVVSQLAKTTSLPISIDTCKGQVARAALDAGASIINDISALRYDPELLQLAAKSRVPLVLMHMQGSPRTMQLEPHYGSLLSEIIAFLEERIQFACEAGISRDQIIIDPGIGFGKTVHHNLLLVKHLDSLATLGRPILLGTSRKSFIGAVLDKDVTEREPGSWATVCAGIIKGAHLVRVHEVKTCRQMADMVDAIINA
ncbi:MAG: dihydropteroate synthase [Deltaproteobacteria bacterium]|nr:dihydropteroate synthase [Deltaproteobacteria bacterium]